MELTEEQILKRLNGQIGLLEMRKKASNTYREFYVVDEELRLLMLARNLVKQSIEEAQKND